METAKHESERQAVLITDAPLVESANICVAVGGGKFFAKAREVQGGRALLRLTAHDASTTRALGDARLAALAGLEDA